MITVLYLAAEFCYIFILLYIVLYTSLQINMKGDIRYISKFVNLIVVCAFAKMFIFILSVT